MQADRQRQLRGSLLERRARHAHEDNAGHRDTVTERQVTEILIDCDNDPPLRHRAASDVKVIDARCRSGDLHDIVPCSCQHRRQPRIDALVDKEAQATAPRN